MAEKEVGRLEKMMPFSPEATVVRTYLEWLINLPWNRSTEDKLDLEDAAKILDEQHYGLSRIKERLLEFLAVIDYTLPKWAKDYMAAIEKKLGKAYAEPAGDVRGYIAHVKAQATA